MDNMMYCLNLIKAKNRITTLYYQTSGACCLSFSGGKDSTVVLAIIKQLGLNIPAVFCDTRIELDATYNFVNWVNDNYYPIEIIEPEKSFSKVLEEFGKPVKSKMRSHALRSYQNNPNCKTANLLFGKKSYRLSIANKDFHLLHPDFSIKVSSACCDYLKKNPFKVYVNQNDISGYFTGERISEGGARAFNAEKRVKEGKPICTKIRGDIIIKSPIIDWSDEMVDEFIKRENVPLSEAYTKYGMTRTGCCCCPYSKKIEDMLYTLWQFEPNKYKASMFWLKDVYIAQNVALPFDEEYEKERIEKWKEYEVMRYEMLKKYRPECNIVKAYEKEHLNV